MATIGAFEAKTHLSALLERVAKGEVITITKHGVPTAMLVPVNKPPQEGRAEVIRKLRAFGGGRTLDGMTIRQLIEKGRRY